MLVLQLSQQRQYLHTTYYNIYQEPDDDKEPDDQEPDLKKIKMEDTTPMTI